MKVIQTAGRLKKFLEDWVQLTDDKFIIQCIKGYIIPVPDNIRQDSIPTEPNRSGVESEEFKEALNRLISFL